MKPGRFKYVRSENLDEVVTLLADLGEDATLLAGGQSLIPLMNFRVARPTSLIDISRVPELIGVHSIGDRVSISAATKQTEVERSKAVQESAPLAIRALRHVAHPAIRNMGTFGGSICHADPVAELPAVLLALGGEVVTMSRRGERRIKAANFFVGSFTTTRQDDEVVVSVELGGWSANDRCSFRGIARRRGDFALVSVAGQARVNGGVIESISIVAGGVADVPVRLGNVEASLVGTEIGHHGAAAEAARLASAEVSPSSDFHASGEYRREVCGVLVSRVLGDISKNGGPS